MEPEQDSAVNACSLSNQPEKPVDAEIATGNSVSLTEKTERNEILPEINEAISISSDKLLGKRDEQDCIHTSNSVSACVGNNVDDSEVIQSQNEPVSTPICNDTDLAIKEVSTENEQARSSVQMNDVNGNGAIVDHTLEASNQVCTENEQAKVSPQIDTSVCSEDEPVANKVLNENDQVTTVSAEISSSNTDDNETLAERESVTNKEIATENKEIVDCVAITKNVEDNTVVIDEKSKEIRTENEHTTDSTRIIDDVVATENVLLDNEQATSLNDSSTSAEGNPVANTELPTERDQLATCPINNNLNDKSTPIEENLVASTESVIENEQATTSSHINNNVPEYVIVVQEEPVANKELPTENQEAATIVAQINDSASGNSTSAEQVSVPVEAATIVAHINDSINGNSASAQQVPAAVEAANLEVQKESAINSELEVSKETNKEVEVIEIEDEEDELIIPEPEIQIIEEGRLDGIGEIENQEKINDFNKKIQQAAQVAIRDLCKKVTGRDITSELPPGEIGNAAVNNVEILNKDNEVQQIQEEPKEVQEESQENLEMQRIVQNAISGFFKKPFRNRKSYSFNNSFGNLSIGINTGNVGVINETLTGKFLIQPIVDTALTAIPKKTIEDILKQVKTLSATEYLMLQLKLKLKNCSEIDNPAEQSSTGGNEVKWDKAKYTQLQKIIEPALSTSSQAIVESIMEKAMGLTPAQYLFLYFNLPKVHSDINERCRQAPSRCLPAINQSIMWLLTHLEEYPGSVLPKQVVYQKYFEFCHLSQLKPLGVSDFGKMMKQLFSNVKPKRQVLNGRSFYCYGGLQARFVLDRPFLPKLPNIQQVKEHRLFSCHGCCSVFKKMHNHKGGPKLLQVRGAKEKITATATAVTSQETEEPGFYKSSAVDGEEILVHDPMELLSLTMNEDSGDPLTQQKISSPAPELAKITSRTQLLRLKNSNRIIKFRQYMHSSVKNTLRKYENIVLPHEVFKFNIRPVVVLDNYKLKNWCAEFLDKRIKKLSNLTIAKQSNGVDFEVTCKCCNDVSEVTEEQAQELSDLKSMLKNVIIHKKDGLNYSVKYSLEYEEVPNIEQNCSYNNAFRITKKLCGDSLESHWEATSFKTSPKLPTLDKLALKLTNQHPSVQRLFNEFEDITLPEEVFRSDVDPVIVLDSGEVCDWYEEQLKKLKQKLGTGYSSDIQPSRHSKAKMINFCESDSECSDSDKNKNGENVQVISETCSPLQEGSAQIINRNLKRPGADGTPEILQKKQKFYCTKFIINSPNNQNLLNEDSLEAPTQNSAQGVESDGYTCGFCLKEYNNKKQLSHHTQIHLYCRSCKRRFLKIESMREHLINHCTMNNMYNKPFLHLHRIDNAAPPTTNNSQSSPKTFTIGQNMRGLVNEASSGRKESQRTYSNVHRYPTINLTTSESNIEQVLLGAAPSYSLQRNEPPLTVNSLLNNSKQPQPTSYLRVVNAPGKQVTRYEIANISNGKDINQQTIHLQPAGHLRNTISNNFNRIFLLSNNPSQPATQVPNTYVYLNSSNSSIVQPSPNPHVTSTSNTYNAPDCALGMNHSTSSTEPTTNFMQIVEPSSTTEYASAHTSIDNGTGRSYEHQDHSYYQQQPTFETSNNNLSTLNRTAHLNNVAQNELQLSDFEMPYINNINAEIPPPLAPLNTNTNASNSTNPLPPAPGQFRIRVKDISELS